VTTTTVATTTVPVTTTTSTTVTVPPSTTITTTVPTTTTTLTIPLPPLGHIVLTINPGTTSCGGPRFSPPAVAPFSGEVDGTAGKIGDLGLGCLYIGGGNATALPPATIPDGASSVLDVTAISGFALTLGGSAGSGATDCTQGAGPGKHCLNGNPGTDGLGACASDTECGDQVDACAPDANCFFGPPMPVPNAANPPTSTCIVNAIAQDVTGTANLLTRATAVNASLAARLYLTGDATSPCPRCVSGTCTAGSRLGLVCSGGVGSTQTTNECPPDPLKYVGSLSPTLALGTGTSALTDSTGHFCSDQANPGAFGRFNPRTITESGAPLLGSLGSPLATTLAGVFCIPASGSDLVNAIADLPGPAAISVAGSVSIQLL
jgi:hypothetical protein